MKSGEFGQHLQELETDYRRVSSYFDDIQSGHEKTFLTVQRHLDQSSERSLGELEMKMSHPIKYSKYSMIKPDGYSRAALNPELPSFVSSKYR